MAQFLQGNKTTGAIAWLDKNETALEEGGGGTAANHNRRGLVPTIVLRALAPVAVLPLLVAVGVAVTVSRKYDLNMFLSEVISAAIPTGLREHLRL